MVKGSVYKEKGEWKVHGRVGRKDYGEGLADED